MKIFTIVFILLLLLCFTSCAPAGATEYEYGFFAGLWHSLIAPVSILGSLFSSEIGVVATNNNGFWYYAGWSVEILIFCAIVFRK